jgi:hypothetical protein
MIRPMGVYALSGLAVEADGASLLSIDRVRGYLAQIDPLTGNTTVLNPNHLSDWVGVTDLWVAQDQLWFVRDCLVFSCDRASLTPTLFAELPYAVNGIAIEGSTVYVSCQKSGYIHRFDRTTGKLRDRFPQPGVGTETLAVEGEQLWVCDCTEQTVYCLDRTTGQIATLPTPRRSPTCAMTRMARPRVGIPTSWPGAIAPSCIRSISRRYRRIITPCPMATW